MFLAQTFDNLLGFNTQNVFGFKGKLKFKYPTDKY